MKTYDDTKPTVMSLFTLVIQAAEEAKPAEANPKGPKEHEAPWLKNAGKIWRDASGRFGGGPKSKPVPATLESGGPAKKLEKPLGPIQGPPIPTVGDKISMSVTNAQKSVDKMLTDTGIKEQYNKAIADGGAVINSIPTAIEDFKKDPRGSFDKAKAYIGQKLKDAGSAAKTFAETVLAFVSGKAGEAKKAIGDKANEVSDRVGLGPLREAHAQATKATQKAIADFAAQTPADQVAASALAASGGVAAVGHGIFTEEVLKAEEDLLKIEDPKERGKKIKDLTNAYEASLKAAIDPVKKEGRQKQMEEAKKLGEQFAEDMKQSVLNMTVRKEKANEEVISPRVMGPKEYWHPAAQA